MDLSTDVRDGFAVIALSGRLTATGAPLLRKAVNDLVAAGDSKIVIDMTQLQFVDSSGLGALVGGLKSARVAGGDLRIAAVPEAVRTVLHLTNLDRVLLDHPTPETAFDGH
ncbi:STAS domain-containing protein [Microbacterium sp. ISL-103]|jgi:anti-sigma B factor antagonist|uniref:STAS domain-containing protein n=1 Tax=Microbacterium sp. ISL-103 TaxID=2819156 RepID=UPI001BE93492|nr:STAS domain-containing protein [Microbacterium sp. ISL-103]MBT2475000.1 STAS domain-containing protein [Microbacterium sp. ISL-103]